MVWRPHLVLPRKARLRPAVQGYVRPKEIPAARRAMCHTYPYASSPAPKQPAARKRPSSDETAEHYSHFRASLTVRGRGQSLPLVSRRRRRAPGCRRTCCWRGASARHAPSTPLSRCYTPCAPLEPHSAPVWRHDKRWEGQAGSGIRHGGGCNQQSLITAVTPWCSAARSAAVTCSRPLVTCMLASMHA